VFFLLQIWQCEFCDQQNAIDILAEEIPTEPDVTYMISPAPATTAASCQGDENSMVIFCIDVSGSMGERVSYFLSSFGAHNFKPARYCGTTAYRWHNVTTRQLETKTSLYR